MMRMTNILAALLIISGVLLAMLIPGGPIEQRDFSHISPIVLLLFNLFLTVLGLGSFVLVPFLLKQLLWAIRATTLASISYLMVYMVDLLGWFPSSPTQMSAPLFWIEVAGLLISIPLLMLSVTLTEKEPEISDFSNTPILNWKKVIFILVALSIIAFATCSAINSKS